MRRSIFSSIVLIQLLFTAGIAQNPEWVVYDTSNSDLPSNYVNSIAIDSSGTKWIGTNDGVASFDGTNWTVYNTSNSDLPYNSVESIAIDTNGNIWFGNWGSGSGLTSFDGTYWTVYDTSNSDLPSNHVSSIAIETDGTKWIGTNDGLASFDGTNWIVYDTSNSDLPDNRIGPIVIDSSGIKWMGISIYVFAGSWGHGLVSFDGTNWTVYDTSNSDLPSDVVCSIAIDGSGNKWIGTGGWYEHPRGLALFDGTNWTVHDTSNSELPWNVITSISIEDNENIWIGASIHTLLRDMVGYGLISFDGIIWTVFDESNSGLPSDAITSIVIADTGNKWIGTWAGGLAVFNEGGIITEIDDYTHCRVLTTDFRLYQNFPNPFNPTTTIQYSLPEAGSVKLIIFDIRGQEVTTLLNTDKPPGNYDVQWNGMDRSGNLVSTGIYFCRIEAGEFSKTIKILFLQ